MSADRNKPSNTFCGRTRREFLWQAGAGFTGVALSGLLDRAGFFSNKAFANAPAPLAPSANPLSPKPQQFNGKAKSVIFLFMYGGPSHVDTFDYKPKLYELDGKSIQVKTFGRGGHKKEGRGGGAEGQVKRLGQGGGKVRGPLPPPGGRARGNPLLPPL